MGLESFKTYFNRKNINFENFSSYKFFSGTAAYLLNDQRLSSLILTTCFIVNDSKFLSLRVRVFSHFWASKAFKSGALCTFDERETADYGNFSNI